MHQGLVQSNQFFVLRFCPRENSALRIEIVQQVAQYDLDKNGPSPKLLQCLDEVNLQNSVFSFLPKNFSQTRQSCFCMQPVEFAFNIC